ncbi:MAG: GNAT family N-acetyltransferase [Acetobacteraceae bacterium]
MARYPRELEERWPAGEEVFLIRPIRPADAAAHNAFFHRLTPDDVRFRFFSAVRELTPEQREHFTRLDYERDMALIAVHEASGEIVGVARLTRAENPRQAEFAVVVQHDLQGRGIAAHLMQRLLTWAPQHGVREVVGSIMAENEAMLDLARFLGFRLRRLPADPQIVEARLSVTEAGDDGPNPRSGPTR